MEGIERITQRILDDAKSQVVRIEEETASHIQRQKEDAERMRGEILTSSRTKAKEDAKTLLKRGGSIVAAEQRKRDLAARQAEVEHVIAEAVTYLQQAPAEDRASWYADWIKRHGIRDGVITLSKNDQAIGQQLLAKLPEGQFEISDTPGRFSGGVIVSRGRIEDNLTYDLVIRNYKPELANLAQMTIDDIVEKGAVDA